MNIMKQASKKVERKINQCEKILEMIAVISERLQNYEWDVQERLYDFEDNLSALDDAIQDKDTRAIKRLSKKLGVG